MNARRRRRTGRRWSLHYAWSASPVRGWSRVSAGPEGGMSPNPIGHPAVFDDGGGCGGCAMQVAVDPAGRRSPAWNRTVGLELVTLSGHAAARIPPGNPGLLCNMISTDSTARASRRVSGCCAASSGLTAAEVVRAPGLRIGCSPQHVHRDPIPQMTVRRFPTLGAPASRERRSPGSGATSSP